MLRKNIDCLCDANGVWFNDSKDITNMLVDHFAQTVKNMSPWSSPGPDGFQDGFYRYIWDIDGKDVTNDVQGFFESGYMPTEFNNTYLSLIPKCDNAIRHVDFRLIGLCNTIYKVIFKIIADRIKPHLKHIISSYQPAFAPGRDIHDNIIIPHEMIHIMKHKEGQSGTMALKLDLSKAFDRIEWSFLLGVLKEFGFDDKFYGYINQCISTTNISVLLNGSPTHDYTPSRGVRQGDPLSPYLFILCMEYLSRLLLNAETNHLISGVKAVRNAPGITRLMFADDILIFVKADMHNIHGVMEVLDFFGKVSGQVLNLDKSSVYFSYNLSPSTREILASELKMTEMKDTDKYLGVSLLIGRNKTKAFRPMIQSFDTRLKTWKGKTMNQSARTTMVKHVLNSIPTYIMSCFRIQKTMIDQMDSIQKHFWWGHSNNKDLCLIGCNKLIIPKALGGLGFRNLEHFNSAMLTKIAWKACGEDNSLCMQIIRAKYGTNGRLLHLDKLKEESSWLWISIYSGIEIVQQHSIWIVQCGTKINIWLDNWIIGFNSPPVPIMGLYSIVTFTLVCDIFLPNTRTWNENLIQSLFNHETTTAILNMNVSTTGEDYLIWKPDRKGKFSVKSAYDTLCVSQVDNTIGGDTIPTIVWKTLWHTKVPNRMQLFVWKCLKDIVHVRDKISRYKHEVEPHCVLRNHSTETTSHLLSQCNYAKEIWNALNIDIPLDIKPNVQSTVIRIHNLVQQCNFVAAAVTMPRNSKALGAKGWSLEEEVEAEIGPENFECKALVKKMSTSSGNDYDYYYSSSSSSSSDEDSKDSVAKSKSKTTHYDGAKPSIPLIDQRVTYVELMKRKAEDDEAENRQRRRDQTRRRVQAAEERRRFVDGVPSDSDADASEEETAWMFTERKIKPDRYEREFRKSMKQIEAEAEAEEDSNSDVDPDAHPDFIDGPGADSDEEEDNDDKSDNSDDKKDNYDDSDNSDESDE
ncbi:uncharacterized protein LOC113359908 [Papaver somniferum]|uniref:uncharacterized protein LOC113359908 n=1 Tax=Papaver somniferum TaxID=3469 RepID=UPI000E6FC4C1|nr:uncharacterized protein LOC113359908 [Papaver somniferum]